MWVDGVGEREMVFQLDQRCLLEISCQCSLSCDKDRTHSWTFLTAGERVLVLRTATPKSLIKLSQAKEKCKEFQCGFSVWAQRKHDAFVLFMDSQTHVLQVVVFFHVFWRHVVKQAVFAGVFCHAIPRYHSIKDLPALWHHFWNKHGMFWRKENSIVSILNYYHTPSLISSRGSQLFFVLFFEDLYHIILLQHKLTQKISILYVPLIVVQCVMAVG